MALWYKLITAETYKTTDIIAEFLDIWLQTRKSEDIDPGELAGVIETIYEFHEPPLHGNPIIEENEETMNAVADLLHVWLQTRRSEDINPVELANMIRTIYWNKTSYESPGCWALIEVRPEEIRDYITIYVDSNGRQKKMMARKDERLMRQYVKLLTKGHEPTPIIIAGAVDDDTAEEGIVLIDGRHRTHAAIARGIRTIQAYIPTEDLPKMDKATIKPEPVQKTVASTTQVL